jgi:hypothetical protein
MAHTSTSTYAWNFPIAVTSSDITNLSTLSNYSIQLIIDNNSNPSLGLYIKKSNTGLPQALPEKMHKLFEIRERVSGLHVNTIWISSIEGYFPEVLDSNFVIDPVVDTFNDYCINYMLCKIFIALRINTFMIRTDKMYNIIFVGNTKPSSIRSFLYTTVIRNSSPASHELIPFNFYTTIYGTQASYDNCSALCKGNFLKAYPTATFNTDAKDTDINGTNYKSYIINHGITKADYIKYMSTFKTSLPTQSSTNTQFKDVPQQILITLDASILQNGSKQTVVGGNHKKHVHKYTNITRRKKRRNSKRRPRVSKSLHRGHRTRNMSYPYTHKTSKRRQTQ